MERHVTTVGNVEFETAAPVSDIDIYAEPQDGSGNVWVAGSDLNVSRESFASDFEISLPLSRASAQSLSSITPVRSNSGPSSVFVLKGGTTDNADFEDTDEQARPLTYEQAMRVLDEQARTLLGISGDEFIRRFQAGGFDGELEGGNHSAISFLSVMAAPFGR